MVAIESSSSSAAGMGGYPNDLSAFLLDGTSSKSMISSFHHSDSSWDFNFDDFADVPVYDEATISTSSSSPSPSGSASCSCFSERLPWEDDDDDDDDEEDEEVGKNGKKKKKKKKKKEKQREIDFYSSWPSAKHSFGRVPIHEMKKKNLRRSESPPSSCDHAPEPTRPQQQQQQQQQGPRVRFAPTKVIRTHCLVLGDHPMCEDGLAISLGWDYEESRDILAPITGGSDHGGGNANSRWRRILRPAAPSALLGRSQKPARLLSLAERMKLLREVGGLSEAELEKRAYRARFLGSDFGASSSPSSPRSKRRQQQQKQQNLPPTKSDDSGRKLVDVAKADRLAWFLGSDFGVPDGRRKAASCDDDLLLTGGRRRRIGGGGAPAHHAENASPIARPRRRSGRSPSSQPRYAARMA